MSTGTSSTQSKSRYEMYLLMAGWGGALRQSEQPEASQPASSRLAAPLDSRLVASAALAQGLGSQDGPSHHVLLWLRDRQPASADQPGPLRERRSLAWSCCRPKR